MKLPIQEPNFEKHPIVKIEGFDNDVWTGYPDIMKEINNSIKNFNKDKIIISLDCYPGVFDNEILPQIEVNLQPGLLVNTNDLILKKDQFQKIISRNLTDDRVFGVMSHHNIDEFFDHTKIEEIKKKIEITEEKIIVIYGVAASIIYSPDIIIYADMARWEIQQRYRSKEIANWGSDNYDEDVLRKYKRSFFIEWRVADRHKIEIFDKINYLLDTNKKDNPKMITGTAFRDGLKQAVQKPFELIPYFDPGPWGGHWMKEVCDLDKNMPNSAWCFNCVPEENSMYLEYGGVKIEIPSINLVFYQPIALLGDKVHARFGTEFPIRFDFLDTMQGGNLSLQVHPLTEYIQQTFGMNYTQDESYYLLDADEDATVYLGVKENIDKDEMIENLEEAQKGNTKFNDEKYINRWQAKKHDHFLIPAGTIHCSGKNSMVLEISATPYIFTFKLWDWGRLGMDGKPRPVHINHGKKVIQWDRDTNWVKDNLINRVENIAEGDGWTEERTGLHEREFIETRRHWFTKKVHHNTDGGVNVLNLVEGEEALVESPKNTFNPMIVHYAETFVVPAAVGEYTIKPFGRSEGKKIATVKAFVRT